MGAVIGKLYPYESAGDTVSGVTIQYGDIALGAKEAFVAEAVDKEPFVDLSQLQRNNVTTQYGNPCEAYNVALDGNASVFPSNPQYEDMGLWSRQLSDENGFFTTPIVLTLTSEQPFTTNGFTFKFDTVNGIHPTHVNIIWYIGDDVLAEQDFFPVSAFYYCKKTVSNFDKAQITFISLNMPQNRLKLYSIDYGFGVVFDGAEIVNAKAHFDVNPISTSISINTVDFTINNHQNAEYSFSEKQPLIVSFNEKMLIKTFISSSRRTSKTLWHVQSEDYIGIMDGIAFRGGIYVDEPVDVLLSAVFGAAGVPCDFVNIPATNLSGYIPYTTCREALMQVCFAAQLVVDTTNSEYVIVKTLDDTVKHEVPLEKIMRSPSFADNGFVSTVRLAAHTYTPTQDTAELYNATDGGTGEDIEVRFAEPFHSLSITNGVLKTYGANYAVINAQVGCVLVGKKYNHSMVIHTKTNEGRQNGNTVSINKGTLVSATNVDNVLQKCYNHLIKTRTARLKIVEAPSEVESGEEETFTIDVGDMIRCETEYLGDITGRVISQSFNLNGGILVKDTELI